MVAKCRTFARWILLVLISLSISYASFLVVFRELLKKPVS